MLADKRSSRLIILRRKIMVSRLKDGDSLDADTLEPGEYHVRCVQNAPFVGGGMPVNCTKGLGYRLIVRQEGNQKKFLIRDSVFGTNEIPAYRLDYYLYREPVFVG